MSKKRNRSKFNANTNARSLGAGIKMASAGVPDFPQLLTLGSERQTSIENDNLLTSAIDLHDAGMQQVLANTNMAAAVGNNHAEVFSFGDAEQLDDARDLLSYLQCAEVGKWYEPPVNFETLTRTLTSSVYHNSPLIVKRNILTSTFIPHRLLSRQSFERIAYDFLILGNCYLEKQNNLLRKPMELLPAMAKYTRRGIESGQYFYIDKNLEDHEFKKDSIWHLISPDVNQEIYGLPEYLAAINSSWLDNAATVFRRRYYRNGSHAGFILHLTDAAHDEKDIDKLKESLKNSRGPGNFRNLLMYTPNGKPEGLKLIPIGEVAAKDNFADIKSVSRDDILAAHRVPPALLGITPKNAGGFGDPIHLSKVFMQNEIHPLQNRFLQINDWIGEEVIQFKPYSLE